MRFTRMLSAVPALLAGVLAGCAESPVPEPAAELVFASAPAPASVLEAEMPSTAKVREMLRLTQKRCGFDDVSGAIADLMALGDRAFPAYETIIADPKSAPVEVEQAFEMIGRMKTDRRRFVPLVVKRLSAADGMVLCPDIDLRRSDREYAAARLASAQSSVRTSAIWLLEVIGDERDAAALVPLLSDDDRSLRRTAADALAKIGGRPEFAAMDEWLKAGKHSDDEYTRPKVQECRDQLGKRLKANPIPKTLTD